ncbi:MAG: histidine triad nucleotide-binding protein [Gammaproteobacteria bacterium]|nr:histidine triad nucleotide-binding protein [Gammaproteobacteria bacterium]MCL5669596.1 histidine triad nucleotide-binding protein [Gammaproteobacteria bacterium]
MTDCVFCSIIAGKIPGQFVHQDEQVVVFKDIHPKARVHLLVVPRLHVESLAELTGQHDGLTAHMMRLLPQVARAQGLDNGFRTVINTGPGGGQEVPHLHIHLLGGGRLPGF